MQALTFSQVVEATIASVKKQMANSSTSAPSSSLIVRHAMKHAASAEHGILIPVCEAVRDRLYHESIEARLPA